MGLHSTVYTELMDLEAQFKPPKKNGFDKELQRSQEFIRGIQRQKERQDRVYGQLEKELEPLIELADSATDELEVERVLKNGRILPDINDPATMKYDSSFRILSKYVDS